MGKGGGEQGARGKAARPPHHTPLEQTSRAWILRHSCASSMHQRIRLEGGRGERVAAEGVRKAGVRHSRNSFAWKSFLIWLLVISMYFGFVLVLDITLYYVLANHGNKTASDS